MIFIETSVFTKQVQKLLSSDEYRNLQIELVTYPNRGSIISGSGGLRKIRWNIKGQGKRGGVRIIYYWAVAADQVIMLYMYPKTVQDNLTSKQLKILKQIVEEEFK
jgi:hypothetical protein